MIHNSIVESPFSLNILNGNLIGGKVIEAKKCLNDLVGFFDDESKRSEMKQDELIYEVLSLLPVKENTEGGLFFGRTIIHPGKVGDEYYMTKGHFHSNSNRAEYYWGLEGEGMLILMNRDRNTWAERIFPGSLHYIPGHVAHRTANISNIRLIIGACWPSDAGHDYDEIQNNGFSSRLMEVNGKPQLIG